jgi:hypothetical protein
MLFCFSLDEPCCPADILSQLNRLLCNLLLGVWLRVQQCTKEDIGSLLEKVFANESKPFPDQSLKLEFPQRASGRGGALKDSLKAWFKECADEDLGVVATIGDDASTTSISLPRGIPVSHAIFMLVAKYFTFACM